MTDIDLDEFDPPDRPDFRRVGKGVPFVMKDGKRVRYGRSSNGGKILDDDSNLTDWKLRTVVAGAAQRPELMAAASVLDVDTDKKKLRDIAEECLVAGKGQRRSIIGTAVHSMFDHIDRRDGWIPPPQFAALCEAYEAMKDEWGFEVEDIEVHCINDDFRLAGTLDRRYRTTKTHVTPDGSIIPIGSLVVADHKTGKELEYAAGSYATQLAAYVDSQRYNVMTDERESFDPESVKDWAIIIHADSAGDRIDVYWVDIRAGRLGLQLAREVKAWRQRDDLLTMARRVRVSMSPPPATAPGPEAPPEPPRSPVGESREQSRYAHLRERVQAVLAHSELASRALQRSWPTGIPGLRTFGHSMDDLDAIQDVLQIVEDQYSLPFVPAWVDPAVEASIINHPSYIWQGNRATSSQGERETITQGLMEHQRSDLVRKWIALAVEGGVDHKYDTTALAHALFEFARFDQSEWPDDDLTLMLDGSLRAMGYVNGCKDLGRFNPSDAPILMSAAFAIAAGNAMLLFDEDEQPVVRTNVKEIK